MSTKKDQKNKQVLVLFEVPDFEVLGTLDSIVLAGGFNNDDGWGWSKLASLP